MRGLDVPFTSADRASQIIQMLRLGLRGGPFDFPRHALRFGPVQVSPRPMGYRSCSEATPSGVAARPRFAVMPVQFGHAVVDIDALHQRLLSTVPAWAVGRSRCYVRSIFAIGSFRALRGGLIHDPSSGPSTLPTLANVERSWPRPPTFRARARPRAKNSS